MKNIYIFFLLTSLNFYAQSDFDKVLKSGEILVNGLSFLKGNKSDNRTTETKFINSICVKNKLNEKITFKIVGKAEDDNDIRKELIIQSDSKECIFELLKGIYTYEILLSSKEIYKKGEYKFEEEMIITIK